MRLLRFRQESIKSFMPTPVESAKDTMPRTILSVANYIDTMKLLGYTFTLNDCNDTIEVNGKRMDDIALRVIRARMRAEGFDNGQAVEDALTFAANQSRYHPVKKYLSELKWDNGEHIKNLSNYFTDSYHVFDVWLRKWLIGAVRKAVEGTQNFMLVMDGPQGVGKSMFAKWLCPVALKEYFCESQIAPDDKDCRIKQAATWIWEVGELGATIRRADVEALKQFISRHTVSERNAYGHYPMHKPTLANYIGTVNNDTGILVDKTGNRRFIISHIIKIDWPGYMENSNVDQIWAEAHEAWIHGETNELNEAERKRAEEISEDYKVPDSIEDFLDKYFIIDPKDRAEWTPTSDIIIKLQEGGFKGNSIHLSMGTASVMRSRGVLKAKKYGDRWGYYGVSEKIP